MLLNLFESIEYFEKNINSFLTENDSIDSFNHFDLELIRIECFL